MSYLRGEARLLQLELPSWDFRATADPAAGRLDHLLGHTRQVQRWELVVRVLYDLATKLRLPIVIDKTRICVTYAHRLRVVPCRSHLLGRGGQYRLELVAWRQRSRR